MQHYFIKLLISNGIFNGLITGTYSSGLSLFKNEQDMQRTTIPGLVAPILLTGVHVCSSVLFIPQSQFAV